MQTFSGKIDTSGYLVISNVDGNSDIGLLGVDRKGEEYYQITLGGSADENTSLGEIVGPSVAYDAVVDAIETVVETYVKQRANGERFLETYRRIGKEPFKENLYVLH